MNGVTNGWRPQSIYSIEIHSNDEFHSFIECVGRLFGISCRNCCSTFFFLCNVNTPFPCWPENEEKRPFNSSASTFPPSHLHFTRLHNNVTLSKKIIRSSLHLLAFTFSNSSFSSSSPSAIVQRCSTTNRPHLKN